MPPSFSSRGLLPLALLLLLLLLLDQAQTLAVKASPLDRTALEFPDASAPASRNLATNISYNASRVFLTQEVDEILIKIPPAGWDAIAVFGMVFGVLLAFFGPKFVPLICFLAGGIAGSFLGALVASWIPSHNGFVWLGLVIGMGLFLGITAVCIEKSAPIFGGIALGILVAGFVNQLGISSAVKPEYVVYIIFALIVLVCTLISYKLWKNVRIVVAALMGGCAFTLGCARFTAPAALSLNAIYAAPSAFTLCHTAGCWGALGGGIAVAVLGVLYQSISCGKHTKTKPSNGPPVTGNAMTLV